MKYDEYKRKHDEYTQSITMLEQFKKNGEARLNATGEALAVAEVDRRAAMDACAKPALDVTPEEWARLDDASKRFDGLQRDYNEIERQNKGLEAGLEAANGLREDLEKENPDHKRDYMQELGDQMNSDPPEPGMGKFATGMQAWAIGTAAVVASVGLTPNLPSDVQIAKPVDQAEALKEQVKDLDFEQLATSRRDEIRENTRPADPPFTTELVLGPRKDDEVSAPPTGGDGPASGSSGSAATGAYEVEASTDPRMSYSVPLPEEFGTAAQSKQDQPAQPLGDPHDVDLTQPNAQAPQADTPLLTYDKQDQKQLTYEEPKLLTDQRETEQPTTAALGNPADSIPSAAPEPTQEPQQQNPTL